MQSEPALEGMEAEAILQDPYRIADRSKEALAGGMMFDLEHQLNNAPRPFDLVSNNLEALGALSIDSFLSAPSTGPDNIDVAYHVQLPASPKSLPVARIAAVEDPAREQSEQEINASAAKETSNVSLLHQTCHKAFGNTNGLKFEYVEETPSSNYLHSFK